MELRETRVEAKLTQRLFRKAAKARIPVSGTFELSPICNFSCRMCYVRKSQAQVNSSNRSAMSLKEWIDTAEAAKQEGILYLLLTGGEPLLWPDFWALYEKLYRMGLLISINTNGSLIGRKEADRFAHMPPSRINLTLYGAGNRTYEKLCHAPEAFDQVRNAVILLKSRKIPMKLNCSLTPQNAEDLEEMIRFSEKNGLIMTVAPYMFPPLRRNPDMTGQNDRFSPEEAAFYHLKIYRLQNGEERYREYLETIRKQAVFPLGLRKESAVDDTKGIVKCRAGRASFWVTWDGYLTLCGMMPEPKQDLRAKAFSRSWKNLTEYAESVGLPGVCERCPDHGLCRSCAASAMAETGRTSSVPLYQCRMVQEVRRLAEETVSLMEQQEKRQELSGS